MNVARLSPLCCVAVVLLQSCIAYNPDCADDNTPVVGRTDAILDLRRDFVRTQEAPIGNLITDAYFAHLEPQMQGRPAIAVLDSGAIRDRNDCALDGFIDRGPITLGQLADILPFDNVVVLGKVTETNLWLLLERAVRRLGDPGQAGLAEDFLQVSHLRFTVDCGQPAAVPGVDGRRITEISIVDDTGATVWVDADGLVVAPETANARALHLTRDSTCECDATDDCDFGCACDPDCDQTYLIVTTSRLLTGSDGLIEEVEIPDTLVRPDFVVVGNHIADHTPVNPTVDGRISWVSVCREES